MFCRGRIAHLALLTLALFVVTPVVCAQESSASSEAPFRVGYAALSFESLAPEFRYIATTIPRLLLEPIAAITSHRLTDEERTARALLVLDAAVESGVAAVHTAVQRRDQLLFDPLTSASQRQSADEALKTARETLAISQAMIVDDVPVPAEVAVELMEGNTSGQLLDAVTVDPAPGEAGGPAPLAEQHRLDLLVWGTVEEIQGYLAVDLYVYVAASGQSELVGGTVARAEDLVGEAEYVAADLAATLLGREWGSLRIEADVAESLIYVDSELVGFGSAKLDFLESGPVVIDIVADGHQTVRREVVVRPGETTIVRLVLEPSVARTVRLESAPAGADVYVDSVWRGTTPLTLPHGSSPAIVRLEREGFLDSRFVVDPSSPDRITRALLPGTVDWGAEIREKRDRFYGSFSWFVISVPAVMLLNGAYQNVLAAFPRVDGGELTPTERALFAQRGNIFYWSFLGATFVSGGLLVNTVISLLDYISVGEGAHFQ